MYLTVGSFFWAQPLLFSLAACVGRWLKKCSKPCWVFVSRGSAKVGCLFSLCSWASYDLREIQTESRDRQCASKGGRRYASRGEWNSDFAKVTEGDGDAGLFFGVKSRSSADRKWARRGERNCVCAATGESECIEQAISREIQSSERVRERE